MDARISCDEEISKEIKEKIYTANRIINRLLNERSNRYRIFKIDDYLYPSSEVAKKITSYIDYILKQRFVNIDATVNLERLKAVLTMVRISFQYEDNINIQQAIDDLYSFIITLNKVHQHLDTLKQSSPETHEKIISKIPEGNKQSIKLRTASVFFKQDDFVELKKNTRAKRSVSLENIFNRQVKKTNAISPSAPSVQYKKY